MNSPGRDDNNGQGNALAFKTAKTLIKNMGIKAKRHDQSDDSEKSVKYANPDPEPRQK